MQQLFSSSLGKRSTQGMWFLVTHCLEEERHDEHTDLARWKSAKLRLSKTKFKRSNGRSDQDLDVSPMRYLWEWEFSFFFFMAVFSLRRLWELGFSFFFMAESPLRYLWDLGFSFFFWLIVRDTANLLQLVFFFKLQKRISFIFCYNWAHSAPSLKLISCLVWFWQISLFVMFLWFYYWIINLNLYNYLYFIKWVILFICYISIIFR